MEYTDMEWLGISGEEEMNENEVEGLDFVEQQRSGARACRWDLQPEFYGIPIRNENAIPRAIAEERKWRKVSQEDQECFRIGILEFSKKV